MAYKDEYEVARLYADPAFRAELQAQFADTRKLSLWLAPPLISRTDPKTGRPAKRKFGPWIFTAFAVLARLKGLRGTWADPFGHTAERRAERKMREDYFELVESLCDRLDHALLPTGIQLAELSLSVRGYGPVKEAAMEKAEQQRAELLAKLAAYPTSAPSHIAA